MKHTKPGRRRARRVVASKRGQGSEAGNRRDKLKFNLRKQRVEKAFGVVYTFPDGLKNRYWLELPSSFPLTGDIAANGFTGEGLLRAYCSRGIDGSDGRQSGLGSQRCRARGQDNGTACALERLPCVDRQAPRAVELQRQSVIPFRVNHGEQIGLEHGTRYVNESIDTAIAIECLLYGQFGGSGLAQIESKRKPPAFGLCL